jgi:hypothetical protein
MRKIFIYLVLVLFLLITSCGKKTELKYFDTGKIKEERIYEKRNDTTKYQVVYYYLNGQIKSKGLIVKGQKAENWQEWYADGSMKWSGEYQNDIRKFEILSSNLNPRLILNDSILRKDKQTYLKVHIDGIHPADMAVACNNGIIRASNNRELFDYMIVPKQQGIMKFFFFVKKDGQMFQVGIDSLMVIE